MRQTRTYLASAFVLAVMSASFHERKAFAEFDGTNTYLINQNSDNRGYDDGGWDAARPSTCAAVRTRRFRFNLAIIAATTVGVIGRLDNGKRSARRTKV
jgi:hypothetical protein